MSEIEDEVEEILELNLRAEEKFQEMDREFDDESISEAFVNVGQRVVDNANEPERKKIVLLILVQIGQALESDEIVRAARMGLEDWKETHMDGTE